MRKFVASCLIVILLVTLETPLRAEFEWEQSRFKKIPYVSFDSFLEFYEFKRIGTKKRLSILEEIKDFTHIKGPLGDCLYRKHSREFYWNERLLWLSFPIYQDNEENLHLARVDVVKLFEPIFRPYAIKDKTPLKGVIIDPGHGGSDHGGRGKRGLIEKKMNLDVALRLRDLLKENGIGTVMTRYRDTFITLEERAKFASKHKDFVFISIHFNYNRSSKPNGIETYTLTPRFSSSSGRSGSLKQSDREKHDGNNSDELNVLLASCVHNELLTLPQKPHDRGMKRARFVILRRSTIPSILIEGGFLSSYKESKWIATSEYRQNMAQKIANGITRYYEFMQEGEPGFRAPEEVGLRNNAAK
ncbi:MAG: N-acetylmuramoyl-L-alanine amidase [Verrucomicrobiota bacterium]